MSQLIRRQTNTRTWNVRSRRSGAGLFTSSTILRCSDASIGGHFPSKYDFCINYHPWLFLVLTLGASCYCHKVQVPAMSCPAEGAPTCTAVPLADDAVGNAETLRHLFATSWSQSYMRRCCTKFWSVPGICSCSLVCIHERLVYGV